MDALDRALIQRTLNENAALERTAGLLLRLARSMQALAWQEQWNLGVPPLEPAMLTDEMLGDMIRTLRERIKQPIDQSLTTTPAAPPEAA